METLIHDGGGDHLIHGDREPRCLIARTVIVSEVGRVVMLNKTYRGCMIGESAVHCLYHIVTLSGCVESQM